VQLYILKKQVPVIPVGFKSKKGNIMHKGKGSCSMKPTKKKVVKKKTPKKKGARSYGY